MKLLPYENIEIFSTLSPSEAQAILEPEVKRLKLFSFGLTSSGSRPYFNGSLENYRFNFHRNIQYKNSFLPTVIGSIISDPNGCKIIARMRLMPFILIFITMWLTGVLGACIFLTGKSIAEGNYSIKMLLPFGMFFFGYGIVMAGFHYEARRVKEKLLELFQK